LGLSPAERADLLSCAREILDQVRDHAVIEEGGWDPSGPPFAHWIRASPRRPGGASIFVGIDDELYVNLGEDCRIESLCREGASCRDELAAVLQAVIDGRLTETVWIGGRGPWKGVVLASRGELDLGDRQIAFWGNLRPAWFQKPRSDVRRYVPYRP
jgi:hypothetical protein